MTTRGIVYYTHRGRGPIYDACREQIDRANPGLSVVNVSLEPLEWHRNIVLAGLEPGDLTMFRQMLAGLEAIGTDVVFFCEHDVLYHASHFDFTPPREDVYYFNLNVWAVDAQDGKALYYDGMRMTSGCVASRRILIEHYTDKIARITREGKFSRRSMGYEPGRKNRHGRRNDYEWQPFRSEHPNIEIKGCGNVTRKRFDPSQYRSGRREIEQSWILTDAVPYWGQTGGRFDAFLAECGRDR